MSGFDLGTAVIEPTTPVVAGSYVTITYTYTAGHPVDDTGYVKIVFRYAGDFGTPQFDDPKALNYCSVQTNGNCQIETRWDLKGHTRPWGKSLHLKVGKGFLNYGETITVVFGDKSQGSPGWRMQTFREDTLEFKTLVDPIATYQFKELPQSPVLEVIPGEAVKAICVAPSLVELGEPFDYHLKLEDRWGNPVTRPTTCKHEGFNEEGSFYVEGSDEQSGLKARSNPVRVVPDLPRLRLFWGDFHGQSEETVGSNTIDDYLRFGRDYSFLDIVCHQGNDFQVSDEFWTKIQTSAEEFNKPGELVVYPGYEWSGNTPLGGDRNVYFASGKGSIARSCRDLLPEEKSIYNDAPTAEVLFDNLRKQMTEKPFVFAHVGGRYANMAMHDDEIELAVEIHSTWGTFEWLLHDALKLGHRVGVCAQSDGHKGRPGSSYPGASRFGSFGGLTCVLAERLDRESVYEALKARRFYATTGARILVEAEIVTPDGTKAVMGEVVEGAVDSCELKVRAIGTAPVESVDVFLGDGIVTSYSPYTDTPLGNRIKVLWGGAEVRGRSRMVAWDGELLIEDNTIEKVEPINFWNPDTTIMLDGENCACWKSITTGGDSGCILTLKEESVSGILRVKTLQGEMTCDLDALTGEAQILDLGGLEKRISVYRLPMELERYDISFSIPISQFRTGDNPIYVRVNQLDGHKAWTSPIYLVR